MIHLKYSGSFPFYIKQELVDFADITGTSAELAFPTQPVPLPQLMDWWWNTKLWIVDPSVGIDGIDVHPFPSIPALTDSYQPASYAGGAATFFSSCTSNIGDAASPLQPGAVVPTSSRVVPPSTNPASLFTPTAAVYNTKGMTIAGTPGYGAVFLRFTLFQLGSFAPSPIIKRKDGGLYPTMSVTLTQAVTQPGSSSGDTQIIYQRIGAETGVRPSTNVLALTGSTIDGIPFDSVCELDSNVGQSVNGAFMISRSGF